MNAVTVYCGSSTQLDQSYHDAAESIGEGLGKKNLSLVYGGGRIGLMGEVAISAATHGSTVIGVITHGYFTADAIDKIIQCTEITDMIVTNSICQDYNQTQWTKKTAGWLASLGVSGSAKFHVIDVSHQLGEADPMLLRLQ